MTTARGGTLVLATTLLAALAGCAGCDSVPDAAITDCDQQVVPGGAATDVLFVVDDSGSMREEQEELAANLGQFIDALVNAPVRLDIRIGVTNTSLHGYPPNDQTTYGSGPSAGKPYPAGTIVAIEQDPQGLGTAGKFVFDPAGSTTFGGARILSSGPNLSRDFKANVLQGIWGAGKEQPLEAMRLALEKSVIGDVNSGFQRAGARLAVVVLTDEDDCSSDVGAVADDGDCDTLPDQRTPLDEYVSYLASTRFNLAGPPIFALIAGFDSTGTTTALCRGSDFVPPTSTSAWSVPTRLDAFVDLLDADSPGRTLRKSICGAFGPSLLEIASMIIPQTVPLDQAPEDYRMLTVALNRGGTLQSCPVALEGSAGPGTGAVFVPPQPGSPALLRFQGPCVLGVGDRVEIGIICAR